MANYERIQYLLTQYFNKSASPQEERELFEIMNTPGNEQTVKEIMDSLWGQQSPDNNLDDAATERAIRAILNEPVEPAGNIRRFYWMKVAALLVLAVSLSTVFVYLLRRPQRTASVAHTVTRPVWQERVALPGDQQLVTLPDSTRVWLNAGSRLRYPAAFSDTGRLVYLEGEAYFEVATRFRAGNTPSGRKLPFMVRFAMDGQVEVLGTHFNIRAYKSEREPVTTLLEGAVKIKKGSAESLLQPGEQGRFLQKGGIEVLTDEKAASHIAWKEGLFDFRNERIEHIMPELARWYNIRYEFKGTIPVQHYTGSMRRQVSLKDVLTMLEAAGSLQFTVEGNRVVVHNK